MKLTTKEQLWNALEKAEDERASVYDSTYINRAINDLYGIYVEIDWSNTEVIPLVLGLLDLLNNQQKQPVVFPEWPFGDMKELLSYHYPEEWFYLCADILRHPLYRKHATEDEMACADVSKFICEVVACNAYISRDEYVRAKENWERLIEHENRENERIRIKGEIAALEEKLRKLQG